MNLGSFFAELKRRNVYKVAVAYAVVGWLLVQVTTQVFPIFEIPNWALRLIVLRKPSIGWRRPLLTGIPSSGGSRATSFTIACATRRASRH